MKYEKLKLGEVLGFWFEELTFDDWFAGGEKLDETIRVRFSELHERVAAGEYWRERTSPLAYLAEVIVLDQFSRQIYRGQSETFAYDGMALTLAQEAIAKGYHSELGTDERRFLYMPFMHSESKLIHEDAVTLFESLGDADSLKYEQIHKDIIDQFGRYPHRNEQLGRESTPEEIEFLKGTNEDFFAS